MFAKIFRINKTFALSDGTKNVTRTTLSQRLGAEELELEEAALFRLEGSEPEVPESEVLSRTSTSVLASVAC